MQLSGVIVGSMKALNISDKENTVMALRDKIRRNDASRYDHRLHGVLLVAQGMTCPSVAELLGDSPRSVVNWVQRFATEGLAGLSEEQRPQVAKADPELQAAHKKTPRFGRKSGN